MHEIHVEQFKIHMYIKYKTHYTVYTQDYQLNKKYHHHHHHHHHLVFMENT